MVQSSFLAFSSGIKRLVLLIGVCASGGVGSLYAQNAGLSFSFFFPRNGYFSNPISPFSIGGIGTDLTRNFSLETGFSLYRMGGLNVTKTPISGTDPFIGPNFTLLIPGELVLKFGNKKNEVQLKIGAFAFMCFDNKINYGHIDKAIRGYEGWDLANSELSIANAPGWGGKAGAEYIFYLSRDFGLTLELNYFLGSAITPISGRYWGAKDGSAIQYRNNVEWKDATIDFSGIEISIGVLFGK